MFKVIKRTTLFMGFLCLTLVMGCGDKANKTPKRNTKDTANKTPERSTKDPKPKKKPISEDTPVVKTVDEEPKKEFVITLGVTRGNYADCIKRASLRDSIYIADQKPFPVAVMLPNKTVIKGNSNYAYSSTERCIIDGASFRIPVKKKASLEDAIAIAADFAKTNGILEAWNKKLKVWDRKKDKAFRFEEKVGDACILKLTLENGFQGWYVSAEVNLSNDALAQRIDETMKGVVIPPDLTIEGDRQWGPYMAMSTDGSKMALNINCEVQIRTPRTGKLIDTIELERTYSKRLAFSADGKFLAVLLGHPENTAIWDLSSKKKIKELKGHCSVLPCFTKAVRFENKSATVVSIESGDTLVTFEGDMDRKEVLDVSPDAKRVIIGGHWKSAGVYSLETGKCICALPRRWARIVFTDDGAVAVGADHMSEEIYQWDADTGKETKKFKALAHSEMSVSPDGQIIAGANMGLFYKDAAIRLYDRAGNELYELGLMPEHARSIAFTPDGNTLITTLHQSKKVHIWHLDKLPKK